MLCNSVPGHHEFSAALRPAQATAVEAGPLEAIHRRTPQGRRLERRRLLRGLREHGYHGGYTILKDYLQPLREVAARSR